ncbi:MAG: LytTR family DNA-binding domain-containing protein [Paeniclostridium sordellii]|uniref:Stage 0 sporulation protein A homolog n=1 Tax=Paeniclostridium hominis TaxID=2764329 RepID=A0ABR7K651_9FIRM|nr:MULTISPECIES: LytTR family DNA-binding domain-containing protein [Paeniclostridium]MBC6004588.1 response regulator transcription factor [Paeniclostridium hominis]MDU2591588.1 LytTR family DNA-binding domain-containing protein [Paeniclostridium sordellii]
MIEIVLCEDQIQHQKTIEKFLKEILGENNIEYNLKMYKSGEELLNNYPKNVDIFILDIQMEKINGMDVARKIREIDKNKPEIIFTTSLVEYIQEGYEVRAYRYLLKPIKYEDLKKHILSCIDEVINKKDKFILIENKNETYKIKIEEITYIEIQRKDMSIHAESKVYETKMTMDKIEKELKNYNFYRCHKSFLVNIDYVENIKQYVAILDNKEEVPVSRHRFKDFKHKFLCLLGEKLC